MFQSPAHTFPCGAGEKAAEAAACASVCWLVEFTRQRCSDAHPTPCQKQPSSTTPTQRCNSTPHVPPLKESLPSDAEHKVQLAVAFFLTRTLPLLPRSAVPGRRNALGFEAAYSTTLGTGSLQWILRPFASVMQLSPTAAFHILPYKLRQTSQII